MKWADGVTTLVPYEALKRHAVTACALLDFMAARVSSKRDVYKHAASVRTM